MNKGLYTLIHKKTNITEYNDLQCIAFIEKKMSH